jgi:energy-coupling factor transporter ATP-binding protein EcfA2
MELLKESLQTENIIPEHEEWLQQLIKMNNTNFPNLMAKFIIVREKMITKLNTFVLHGPPNCGKSMLIQMLTKPLKPEILIKSHDMNQFYFSSITNATAVVLEEPMIWTQNVNIYKTLLGGEPHVTDKKYDTHHLIPRTPFFITTNEHELGERCNPTDKQAIKVRSYQIPLTTTIGSTGALRPPQKDINSDTFYNFILKQKEEIEKEIEKEIAAERPK